MRKATKAVANAFEDNQNYRNKHDSVIHDSITGITKMFYRGNNIATKYNDNTMEINSCGYMTNTIKDRLNGLNGITVYQEKGLWYLNGNMWNGELTLV